MPNDRILAVICYLLKITPEELEENTASEAQLIALVEAKVRAAQISIAALHDILFMKLGE